VPLFGRKRPAVPDGPPDETFTFFTSVQAARFRDLARQGFAEAGLEVTMHPDHVVDDAGRMFGLGNLAAACHNADRGEKDWRTITRDHAARIVRSLDQPSPFETLSRAELLASTYLRLTPTADLAPVRTTYAREVVDGISEVLNLDLPETVMTYLDEHVEQLGPLEDLRRVGLVNLRRVRFDERQKVAAPGGGAFDVLLGESMFTASKLLVLEEVLAEQRLDHVKENGVLVVAPFRHQLAVHPIRDSSVVPALQGLALFAQLGHDDAPGPLSPHVYWWRAGSLRQLSRRGPDGVEIQPDDDFSEVLERVT
jgi:hypothetical protein